MRAQTSPDRDASRVAQVLPGEERVGAQGPVHPEHLLNAAATLTGTCLAAVSVLCLEQALRNRSLFGDNVLAVAALGFLVTVGMAYLALRRRSRRLHRLAEGVFALSSCVLALALLALVFETLLV
ncbi:MAG TPA: hypothetical protein VFB73_10830 [Chloroflexota bacterium]|nr:hypothetical protein [Chloroflexota bacterium]